MALNNIFKNIEGIYSSTFQIGIDNARLKASTTELQARNPNDDGFVPMSVGAPTSDQHAVTKYYADTLAKPVIISAQADTSVSIPNNTGVRRFLVVTTAGNGAVIGDLLYDDGSGSGQMQILAAVEGRCIAVTDTLSGGTATFEADSIYIWDADNTTWIKIGDIGSVTGAIRAIRYAITNAATQDSTSQIPANSRVFEAILIVTTPYSAGATIQIGTSADPDAFMLTTQNQPLVAKTYSVEQDNDVGGSDAAVRTTVGGTPAAGAGVVIAKFSSVLN